MHPQGPEHASVRKLLMCARDATARMWQEGIVSGRLFSAQTFSVHIMDVDVSCSFYHLETLVFIGGPCEAALLLIGEYVQEYISGLFRGEKM